MVSTPRSNAHQYDSLKVPVVPGEVRIQRRYPATEGTPHPGWGEAGSSSNSHGARYKKLSYAIRAAEVALDEYREFNRKNSAHGDSTLVRRIEYRVVDAEKNVLWQSSTDEPDSTTG
jgi:hypothetical protein